VQTEGVSSAHGGTKTLSLERAIKGMRHILLNFTPKRDGE